MREGSEEAASVTQDTSSSRIVNRLSTLFIEAINDGLQHIGVSELMKRPLHVVIEVTSPTKWKIEAAVPRLAVLALR